MTNERADLKKKAVFVFTEESRIEVFWYVKAHMLDWMGMVYRDSPTSPWKLTYRFKYYASPDDPSDPNDRRSAYELTVKDPTPEGLIAKTDRMVAIIAERLEGVSSRHVVGGGTEDLNRVMAGLPFVHARMEAPGSDLVH